METVKPTVKAENVEPTTLVKNREAEDTTIRGTREKLFREWLDNCGYWLHNCSEDYWFNKAATARVEFIYGFFSDRRTKQIFCGITEDYENRHPFKCDKIWQQYGREILIDTKEACQKHGLSDMDFVELCLMFHVHFYNNILPSPEIIEYMGR